MALHKKNIAVHLLIWVIYLLLLVYFYSDRYIFELALFKALYLIIPQVFLVNFNTGFLMPRYYFKKKYLVYFAWVLAAFFLLFLYFHLTMQYTAFRNDNFPGLSNLGFLDEPHHRSERFIRWTKKITNFNLLESFAIFLLAMSLKTSQKALENEKKATELRNENLQSELKFLKSQINPHFLFNALNNIYSLSIIKSEKAPDTLLKLSEMLRYIIYDCNHDSVPIKKELKYIEHYVNLLMLKDEGIQNIHLNFDVDDPSKPIAPMLLIPFLENAFKHSKIEDTEKGWIKVDLKLREGKLKFNISNSMPEAKFSKDKTGGIGLENVKKRLTFIYPNRYELNIKPSPGKFEVDLNIQL